MPTIRERLVLVEEGLAQKHNGLGFEPFFLVSSTKEREATTAARGETE